MNNKATGVTDNSVKSLGALPLRTPFEQIIGVGTPRHSFLAAYDYTHNDVVGFFLKVNYNRSEAIH